MLRSFLCISPAFRFPSPYCARHVCPTYPTYPTCPRRVVVVRRTICIISGIIFFFSFIFLQLHSSSDRGGGGYRSGARGCPDPLRMTTTSVVQRRKQSEHLFGLLLEICHISPAETQLLLRAGTISRWVALLLYWIIG